MARQLRHAIGDRPVIIFNARFDIRILKQTAAAHSDPADWLEEMTVYCAMELAAGYYGATNRYGTISLASAASQAGLTWEGQAHSAIADARMTAGVVNAIAAYHLELLQEQERLKTLKRIIWLRWLITVTTAGKHRNAPHAWLPA